MHNFKSSLDSRMMEFISDHSLFSKSDRLLLAVSGGLDSVVMTHLFSKMNYDIGIAHCNFSMRGKESDQDELFVRDLAGRSGKIYHSKKFDTQKFAEENKISIQEAARILRYDWFDDLCSEFNYIHILTAHHLNDSIETFFINLMRGTGPEGLKGIPVKNKKVVRPLLFATRDEIEGYALQNNIAYRTDSSNAGDEYLRNRIRHHLIPAIKTESKDFEGNMKSLMEDFSVISGIVHNYMTAWKEKNVQEHATGNVMVPLSMIKKESYPSSFLSLLLYTEGIKGIDCKKILASETTGKIFQSKEATLLIDREFLIIQKKADGESKTIIIEEIPAMITTENLKISILEKPNSGTDSFTDTNKIQQVDSGKIKLPLTLRKWEKGDYFFPIGMKGKKKISDFYTDEKIDRFQKDKIYLLLSGRDIVCILGHRIDERFKITSSTKKILTIELSDK